ncbi:MULTISPECIES: flagellar biosynthetic protein FliR [unclassified Thioclava]|uniref:flagellar biosynthetic protein FliR n=1 Tax=unclassified Thioclava TaxID=2621713 RepID=UPI001E3A8CF3|nr:MULTISPECIES: flagellar biosynthetic protein FliR [unclassified Thioclava]
MSGLSTFLDAQLFGYLIVFARLGSAMMFMPGFGEMQVPTRSRLAMAVVFSLALYPATPVLPMQPDNLVTFAIYLGFEVTTGIWIGLTARVLFSALQFAGHQAGQVSGLANAFAPSLGSFEGSTMIASFLLISGVALIFVTNTHHVIIRALLYSYDVFPPGTLLLGDMAKQIVKAASASLYIGAAIAAPFFVMGLIFNLGMGLANRMMPALPVFFVAAPALIASGLLILAAASPSMLHVFLGRFTDWLGTFVIP